MALQFIDSFAHYTNLNNVRLSSLFPELWTDISESGGASGTLRDMPIIGGRAVHARMQIPGAYNTANLRLRLPRSPVSGETWIIGSHVYIESIAAYRTSSGVFGWGSGTGSSALTLGIDSDGLMRWMASSPNSSVVANSTFSFAQETVYHVEWKTYFHATEGFIQVRINGILEFTVTDLNTLPSTVTHLLFSCFQAGAGGSTNANGWLYANLFILDDVGGAVTDWLGPCRVALALPNEDKSPQDWTLSTGSDAYDLINNVPPLPSTEYIAAEEVGDEAAFGFASIGGMAAIRGVQFGLKGRSSNIVPVGVELNGVEFDPLSPSQAYRRLMYEQNPDGDVNWSPTTANSFDATLKRIL